MSRSAWWTATRSRLLGAGAAFLLVGSLAFVVVFDRSSPEESGRSAPSTGPFRVLSPSASDFPQHVNWVTVCQVTKNAEEDPIVFPGETGRSHDHTFSGNTEINPFSTAELLVDQPTNCTNSGDTASYWMPTLLVDGHPVMPYMVRAYYRAATRDTTKLQTIPFGLKIVAGDAHATSPQSPGVAGFHCRIEGEGATVAKQALPPDCGPQALLEASVVFPNCWDGENLDSADHSSHMSYAENYVCDAAHPVQLPQLTLAERFTKGTTSGVITLASMNSPLTLHADFLNAWKPTALAELMKRCIYAHVFCETVSDTRMPPGMVTTVPVNGAWMLDVAPRMTCGAAHIRTVADRRYSSRAPVIPSLTGRAELRLPVSRSW